MSQLSSKVAIVTGGGTGIGLAITEKFVASGMRVLITGRRGDPLEALSQQHPDNVSVLQSDVTHPDDRKAIINAAVERYGRLDVLVNNAALHLVSSLQDSSDAQFEQSYQANLIAPAGLIREAIPHLQANKGAVINISTIGARAIFPGISPYTASKAALDHLTQVTAVELGPLGIRVNAVAPGMTRTDMSESYIDDSITAITPLGRVGEPADIAELVFYLASDSAGWVTGQIIDASGGLRL